MSWVRLPPSPWLQALDSNRACLHRLQPDRLLHDDRLQAGPAPRGERHGGWEAESILVAESLAAFVERALTGLDDTQMQAVLDPLIDGRDEPAFLHANTRIPKLIGLARQAGLTDDARQLGGADSSGMPSPAIAAA